MPREKAVPYNSDLVKDPIGRLKNYDLVLYFASLKTASNQTSMRINWAQPMGADVPKFVHEIPTLFVSVDNPYHLQDAPMVKTFINGYSSNEHVVEAVVDKFLGISPFHLKASAPSILSAVCGCRL